MSAEVTTAAATGQPGALLWDDAGARDRQELRELRELQDRVSLAALSWVHRHLADFTLPDDVTEPHVDRNATVKPLGELTQLSVSMLRAAEPDSEQHRLAREMLDFAWAQAREGELFLAFVHGEPHATYPVEFYASFAEAGLRHPEFERYARFAATTRAWRLAEHEPTRVLALFNAQRRLGIPVRADVPAAMHRTWLGGLAEPWTFEAHAGYALTHYVFHVANWGREPEQLPAEISHYLALWLPSWLDSCLEEGHWDLAGELLAVAASLPRPDAVPAAEAWRAYATAQSSTSGAIAQNGPPPAEDTEDTDSAFLSCYHSTLVGAFASVLAASRNRAGPQRPTGGASAGSGGGAGGGDSGGDSGGASGGAGG